MAYIVVTVPFRYIVMALYSHGLHSRYGTLQNRPQAPSAFRRRHAPEMFDENTNGARPIGDRRYHRLVLNMGRRREVILLYFFFFLQQTHGSI